MTRRHLEEDDAERPHVATRIGGPAAQHFRRHGWKGAGHGSGLGHRDRHRARVDAHRRAHRETKVEHLDPPLRRQDDVRRLQIPVSDATVVRMRERVSKLHADPQDSRLGQTAFRNRGVEREALDQLHRQAQLSTEISDLVDGADIRVVERRRGARLVLEPLSSALTVGSQELEGHIAAKALITSSIHIAHGAVADLRRDEIGPEAMSNHWDCGRRRLYVWLEIACVAVPIRVRGYTCAMKILAAVAVVLAAAGVGAAQEKPVPKDSSRITVPGCAKDRSFVVTVPQGRDTTMDVPQGQRFRLSGPRKVLDDIKKRQGSMVEITGLVRKADLSGPGGLKILGGRVRIGGATPRDPIRDPMYNQIVIDVEGFQILPDGCPSR